ncbi:MAG: hypothetical protein IJ379_14100 [Lachnospiraceae bacterium]|nr:hypothetical protein [Lachnospiraceae bacterium]MBQ7777044.1 hypothetical protein [Lachnospiraceae bacterium]
MRLFGFGKKKEKQGKMEFTPENAQEYLLHESLHGMFAVDDVVENDHIYLPDWKLTITPAIQQLTEKSAVLDFYLWHPDWRMTIYECCASPGKDMHTALGLATGSFLFGIMQGITTMFAKENPRTMETEFAGKPHSFQVYLSDIVGMGESPQTENVDFYWNLLKDDIRKRMGNQRFCYVKVYASVVNGKQICECRINDVISDELSEKITKATANWPASYYASHKQFFFIEQDAATIQPYPYHGEAGEKEFIGKVLKAVQLFHASDTQEAFDTLQERLVAELGDATLATECRLFLPEICAERAGADKVKFSETIDLLLPNGAKNTFYKHQLTDYYALENTLFTIFQQGIFGEETNAIYQELVGTSAICNVLNQMLEKGSQLENCQLTALLFHVDEQFEIR